ncbi:sigma factor-like helix-turn-helix DNA-binding protein [Patescibacteria group bacterium]
MQNNKKTQQDDSILENILSSESEALVQDFNPQEALNFLLSALRDREKKILIKRFGLKDGKTKTLQEIGNQEGITRERVRQIVRNALNKMIKKSQEKGFKPTKELVVESIKSNSGLITEEKFLQVILTATEESDINQNIVRLLLEIEEELELLEKHPELIRSWVTKKTPKETIVPTISAFKEILEKKKEITNHKELVDKLKDHPHFKKNKPVLNKDFIRACMESGHKLIEVEENKWGLKTWREVEPKSVRDVILLEMRREENPLHFKEIAEKVNKSKFARKATLKTVHNELIRDPNIVLIGRGIYALKEWGYEAGTVSEIINKILKKEGPLKEKDIVEKVLALRKVKKNTVVFNLRNNPNFEKDSKGKYTLKKTKK